MLTHCDVVLRRRCECEISFRSSLGLVPEFGSSYSLPARLSGISGRGIVHAWTEPFGFAARAGKLGPGDARGA